MSAEESAPVARMQISNEVPVADALNLLAEFVAIATRANLTVATNSAGGVMEALAWA